MLFLYLQVRVGNEPVPASQGQHADLPSTNGGCGEVEGIAGKYWSGCPAGRYGRYITLQLKDSDPPTNDNQLRLFIKHIKIEVESAKC